MKLLMEVNDSESFGEDQTRGKDIFNCGNILIPKSHFWDCYGNVKLRQIESRCFANKNTHGLIKIIYLVKFH